MILIYTPVIHTYFAFGKMDIQDRLFPILGGIVFLLIRESAKYFQRRKFQKNETEVIETIQTEIK